MFRFIFLVLLFFLSLTNNCPGQSIIEIKKEKESINIGKQIALFQDPTGKLTFEDVSAQSFQQKFIASEKATPNFGSTLLPVWSRIIIKNNTNQQLVLAIDNSQIEWIDLFNRDTTGIVQKTSSVYYPFYEREILLNKTFFWLNTPKDSTETYFLRLQTLTGLQFPLTLFTIPALIESEQQKTLFYGIYIGIMLIMMLYNFLIFLTIKDLSYLLYVVYVSFMTLTNLTDKGFAFEYLWPSHPEFNRYINIIGCLTGIFAILFSISFLHISKYSKKLLLVLYAIIGGYILSMVVILFNQRYAGLIFTEILSVLATIMLFVAGFTVYLKGYKPALFYLVAWTFLLIGVNILILKDFNIVPYNNFTNNGMVIGSAIEALLLSLALGNRINVYKKEKRKAQADVLLSLEENRKLILSQNVMLEKKVEERTLELKNTNKELTETLQNLRDTEAQLIQSEKMASLGELTAGIAHEIQNPLNFVNNFSEVNEELLAEMKDELDKGNIEDAKAIANDAIENQQKILHHGKRADGIVKGMLQHSRSSSGTKELTDINKLADEYLRLAYHGLRAKDKSFNATMKTDFDETIGKIKIIPQDIGRVILNLITNAFYAVAEKKKQNLPGFEPEVMVSTRKLNEKIQIKIKDNGNGIPESIKDKIFQPFFTTKPTGQGTGLGLSLSYDIIKSHGGEINVETNEGKGTTFIITLNI